jgi:hypothetical protein
MHLVFIFYYYDFTNSSNFPLCGLSETFVFSVVKIWALPAAGLSAYTAQALVTGRYPFLTGRW